MDIIPYSKQFDVCSCGSVEKAFELDGVLTHRLVVTAGTALQKQKHVSGPEQAANVPLDDSM